MVIALLELDFIVFYIFYHASLFSSLCFKLVIFSLSLCYFLACLTFVNLSKFVLISQGQLFFLSNVPITIAMDSRYIAALAP